MPGFFSNSRRKKKAHYNKKRRKVKKNETSSSQNNRSGSQTLENTKESNVQRCAVGLLVSKNANSQCDNTPKEGGQA